MKKKSSPMVGLGIPSLLLIFLVLCLVIFSLLSLSSAAADEKLSQKIADRTTDYYQVSNAANDTLGKWDNFFETAWQQAGSSTEYYQKIKKEASSMESTQFTPGDPPVLSWQTPLGESQILSVCLSLPYPKEEGDCFFKIIEWKIENTDDWNPDWSQPVYRSQEKEGK